MARKDILLNVRNGDLILTDRLYGKEVCGFAPVEVTQGDNVHYCFGEITLTYSAGRLLLEGGELLAEVPYIADERNLKIRFSSVMPSGNTEYLINPYTNDIWFPVVNPSEGKEQAASALCSVNGDWKYTFHYEKGRLLVYSGTDTDLTIGESLRQNELFLLKANPGNFYQWPTAGVGLTQYLHGNMEDGGLARKIQSEFKADKMVVETAYMDSATGELFIESKETKNG